VAVETRGVQPWIMERWQLAAAVLQYLTGGTVVGQRVVGGTAPTMTSAFRSVERQAELYADRASNPYPVNRPGDSAHNYGLAIDAWVPDNLWPLWHAILAYVGFRVPSNDRVHAEWPNWRDLVKATGVRL
jgi:hypothetical protein